MYDAKDSDATATGITLVSACLFGPVIVYFIYREHAASNGRRVQVTEIRTRTLTLALTRIGLPRGGART
eukprot:4957629-Prymnesium_polylepis.1